MNGGVRLLCLDQDRTKRLFSASITTWTAQLSTLESRAAEHDRYASELALQVADPLKNLAARYEELRKSHAEYAAKLERERDVSYGDLKKTKGRYDGACQEVENRRKKTESSFDHGKNKAQNAYQQQLMDMHNVKVSGPGDKNAGVADRYRTRTSSTSMSRISTRNGTTMSTSPTY